MGIIGSGLLWVTVLIVLEVWFVNLWYTCVGESHHCSIAGDPEASLLEIPSCFSRCTHNGYYTNYVWLHTSHAQTDEGDKHHCTQQPLHKAITGECY